MKPPAHGPRPHGKPGRAGGTEPERGPRRGPDRTPGSQDHGAAKPPRAGTPMRGPNPPHAAPHQPHRGGHPPAPAGTIWIYGIHPVAAALANPGRRLRRLLVTDEAESTLAAHVKPPFAVAPEKMPRDRLDQLLGRDAVHQGVALLADPLSPPTLAQVLERPGPLLVLDQVTDPRNVGAILRSAAAFGAAGIITQDRHAPDETGALAKAASGALETVPLIRAVNLARTLVALKAANIWCVGLAAEGAPLRGAPLAQRRVALVLGAESTGLRRLTRDTCDELAGLAMPGSMESLNVSAAATVALYELTRVA